MERYIPHKRLRTNLGIFGPQLVRDFPIRNRNKPDKPGLFPDQYKVAMALCLETRFIIAESRNIDSGKAAPELWNKMRKKPTKKTGTKLYSVLGSQRYKQAKQNWGWVDTDGDVTFQMSCLKELIHKAGLSRSGPIYKQVIATLDVLLKPVNSSLPPILLGYKLGPKKVEFTVNAYYVPKADRKNQFFRIPWPLPGGGPIMLRLLLFAISRYKDPDKGFIKYEDLYKRLGIQERNAQRTLNRAVLSLNEYLTELNKTGELDEDGLPTKIEAIPGRVKGYVHLELSGKNYRKVKQYLDDTDIYDEDVG